jgi:hypothetical protein
MTSAGRNLFPLSFGSPKQGVTRFLMTYPPYAGPGIHIASDFACQSYLYRPVEVHLVMFFGQRFAGYRFAD